MYISMPKVKGQDQVENLLLKHKCNLRITNQLSNRLNVHHNKIACHIRV